MCTKKLFTCWIIKKIVTFFVFVFVTPPIFWMVTKGSLIKIIDESQQPFEKYFSAIYGANYGNIEKTKMRIDNFIIIGASHSIGGVIFGRAYHHASSNTRYRSIF